MALMDIAEIEPLMSALAVLLKPGGRFVFSCSSSLLQQSRDRPNGRTRGPEWHHCRYILREDRSLQNGFHAGWACDVRPTGSAPVLPSTFQLVARTGACCRSVLDGIEEHAFPSDNSGGTTPLSWNGRFSEIPAALTVRSRRTALVLLV